jgi:hypothetical protein
MIMKPFKSDGCTLFFDGNWRDCCVSHDKSYWQGGTQEERLEADKKLKECVSKHGHPYIASFMYMMVRIGGSSKMPFSSYLPWRWGFGEN